jgi:hypothetical protein
MSFVLPFDPSPLVLEFMSSSLSRLSLGMDDDGDNDDDDALTNANPAILFLSPS